jgi:hypothetical protein
MSHTGAALTYLVRRREADRITHREMARRLEISESRWCHVRAGRDRLSASVVLRACVLYPELRALIFGEEAVA